VFNAPQDVVCALGCQGTLLTHIEPHVNQHPPHPFPQGCSLATPLPIYTCAWRYSVPGAKSGM